MQLSNGLQVEDLFVVGLYIIFIVVIGMAVSYQRRHETDLFLGGRSFSWGKIGLSIWGTNITPAFLIGGVGIAYTTGMVTATFEWLSWIFLMLLAMVFTPFYSKLKIDTIPQIILKRFGEATYRAMTIYVLYTVIIMWLGGTLLSGGILFSQILGWDYALSIILLMVIATSFTVAGGIAAVMVTDAIQTVLIIIISASIAILGLYEVGGVTSLIAKTPPDYWKLIKPISDSDFPWLAIALGYPIQALWFWCTDQTIVQRMFTAKDLKNAQKGALLAAYLKILPPLIFTFTGVLCFVLFPELDNPDLALMTMVNELLPTGAKGLIVAVLMAALISSVDSALNSFSTVFTLDIYKPWLKKQNKTCTPERLRKVGRLTTLAVSIIAVLWAIILGGVGQSLFTILQGLVSFVAPPIAALMLLALFSKRITAKSAIWGFCINVIISQFIGYLALTGETFGVFDNWPHYLYLSFFLFVMSLVIIAALAAITVHAPQETKMPSLIALYKENESRSYGIWTGWGLLALIMFSIYFLFEYMASKEQTNVPELEGPWPSTVHIYRGNTPIIDGVISPGEYDDATVIEGVEHWNPQFSPVVDSLDLAVKVMIKHDGNALYVAFDVTDDLIYAKDTPRWLPDENSEVHDFTKEGWPWFGDGVELLVNAQYKWSQNDQEYSHGNGHNWQMVASTHKSILYGLDKGGLMIGEPRREPGVWETYENWIRKGDMSVSVRLKDSNDDGSGYIVEWRVNANPCLEVSPGVFWDPSMGETKMGLNLAVGDIDLKENGIGNFGNFHHENWWAGEKDKRIWLKQWGTMIVHPNEKPIQ